MDAGKAVEEVGQWREALGKELGNIPLDKRAGYLNKKGMEIYSKYKMKCPVEKKDRTRSHHYKKTA
jgi:hypothetical protein